MVVRATGGEAVLAAKLELLKKVACLDRGAIATSNDRYEVASFVETLEELQLAATYTPPGDSVDDEKPTYADVTGRVQGKWELLYSSVEQFRSSPFFWAFQEGLVQSRDLSAEVFKFTDSIPGAHIGTAYQTISFDTGKLISEVDMVVFPGLRGTVVTACDIQAEPPNKLSVTVVNTRVANANLLPFIDTVTVPVKEIIEAIRGAGSTRVAVEITYVDEDMRVSRTRPDGEIFVYRRV